MPPFAFATLVGDTAGSVESTTTRCVGGSAVPGARTEDNGWEAIGALVSRSVYDIKDNRLEAFMDGDGNGAPNAPAGGTGSEGRFRGDEVGNVVVALGEPEPGLASAPGGDMLLAGLGALELARGLANPDAKPEAEATPLTLALALARPDIPIPCNSKDMTGGEPPEVPDEEPNDPIGTGCAKWDTGAGERTVKLVPGSSDALSAETAESRTEGTATSSASVVFERGMR